MSFEKEYSLSLNDKNGRDAASCILTTVRESNGAQLAFAPYYYFSSSIYKGECTNKRLNMMVAYTPAVYSVRLNGDSIKRMIQKYLSGLEGSFSPSCRFELPVASGMKLIVQKKDHSFELKDILIDGRKLDEEQEYSIIIVGDAVSALKDIEPETNFDAAADTNLSSAWVNAVLNGYQISKPENYIEIA